MIVSHLFSSWTSIPQASAEGLTIQSIVFSDVVVEDLIAFQDWRLFLLESSYVSLSLISPLSCSILLLFMLLEYVYI